MELEIQKYLRAHHRETFNGLSKLRREHEIDYYWGTKFQELISFKLQGGSNKFNTPFAIETQKLILNVQKNWDIIYYNPHIEKENFEVGLYFYKDKWRMCTRFSIDGIEQIENINDTQLNYKDLFWKLFTKYDYLIPPHSYKELNFIFNIKFNFTDVLNSELYLVGIIDKEYNSLVNIQDFRQELNYQIK